MSEWHGCTQRSKSPRKHSCEMTLVTKDLLRFEILLRFSLQGGGGGGGGGCSEALQGEIKWAKRVWVRMQRSAPFHPEMFISLIPTEAKSTPLELMVG